MSKITLFTSIAREGIEFSCNSNVSLGLVLRPDHLSQSIFKQDLIQSFISLK